MYCFKKLKKTKINGKYSMFMDWRINITKMTILHNLIYRCMYDILGGKKNTVCTEQNHECVQNTVSRLLWEE